MDNFNFIQRMIESLHGRVVFNLSPDRRNRKLAVVNTFTGKGKTDRKKENSSPLNNAKALTLKPRNEEFTDLNLTKIGDSLDEKELKRGPERYKILEREGSVKNSKTLVRNPEILKNEANKSSSNNSQVQNSKEEVKRCNSVPAEVHRSVKGNDAFEEDVSSPRLGFRKDPADFSHNLLPSISTSNLLEEIEAGLPESCSLVNMLDHTPHTVTNVRTFARLSRVGKNLIQMEEDIKQIQDVQEDTVKRVRHLQTEAYVQKTLIDQADKVLQLCKDREKNLQSDYIETLRILLVAKLRYEAINMELQNIKLSGGEAKENNFGEVSVTCIDIKLKDSEILERGPFICIAFQKEHLFPSHVQSEVTDGKLHFPVNFKFSDLHQNFIIYLELYQLNYYLKPKKETSKVIELKNLMKMAKQKTNKNLYTKCEKQDFVCIGTASLRLVDVKNRQNGKVNVDITKVSRPEFEKSVSITLGSKVSLKAELNGFLNLFKSTCWHRLWCCLTDYSLQFWNYPDDKDNGKEAFESVYLPRCREDVKPVGMEICIRPYTFMISHKENDKGVLLSASSHRDMMNWVNQLKSAIHYLQMWNPDF